MPRAVADWIGKNLWALLAMVGIGFQGYNVGIGTLAEMNRRLAEIETRHKSEDTFRHCAIRTVDWIKSGSKGQVPCELE